ncbi:MAG: hypothetical protein U1C46_01245 [Bacteroidales bacterium]|nr:hypothetical protein [Bacteroidales bacterium]MDZ4203417.1 hypothetical protein [Bacteroidales bacterium]
MEDNRTLTGISKYLFPHYFKFIGLVLALAGAIFSYIRFGLGIKPDFLDTKVFAIHAVYFKTSYFTHISNNISEEIAGVFLLAGLFFIAFSKEKTESPHYWLLRLKALLIAVYLNTAIVFLAFIFIYGMSFAAVMVINLFGLLVFYNIAYFVLLYLNKRNSLPASIL